MLAFLYTEGSWTRGIFRRPAGARAVRELRDSLDSGSFQLPLTRDHVFVIAGVFKVGHEQDAKALSLSPSSTNSRPTC